MKNKFEKTMVIDAVGTLDRNDNGELVLSVEEKDNFQTINLEELLNQLTGTEVQIKSVASYN
jgi:hypothetical protein